MTNDDLCLLSIDALATEIALKRVSPVEVTEAVLERIERMNPRLNAYLTVTAEAALEAARAAEAEIADGAYRGKLHGVPVAHKDLFATKDVRTTAGSKILADWVPDYDATPVARLADAGAVSLGKLGMHEWAFGVTSDNEHFGPVRNPWNTEHVPGGSSGGSGAAVAGGLAFAATGSDTGGSIRVPAHYCGCAGIKPTYGRVSLHGAVPLAWSLDHPGPLARTVRDCAIVLQAIAGKDPLDPVTSDLAVPDFLDGLEHGPSRLRVGVPKQYFWDGVDAEVERLVRKALMDLEAGGAEIVDMEFTQAAEWYTACTVVLLTEAAAYHASTFPSRKQEYGKQVARLLEAGASFPGVSYVMARRTLEAARTGAADALLEGVDVLAVPTCPNPAPSIEDARKDDSSTRVVAFTAVFDLTGQPAISVPCGLTAQGLPVGISFVGRRWDERSVLQAGRSYEQVRGEFPAPMLAER